MIFRLSMFFGILKQTPRPPLSSILTASLGRGSLVFGSFPLGLFDGTLADAKVETVQLGSGKTTWKSAEECSLHVVPHKATRVCFLSDRGNRLRGGPRRMQRNEAMGWGGGRRVSTDGSSPNIHFEPKYVSMYI